MTNLQVQANLASEQARHNRAQEELSKAANIANLVAAGLTLVPHVGSMIAGLQQAGVAKMRSEIDREYNERTLELQKKKQALDTYKEAVGVTKEIAKWENEAYSRAQQAWSSTGQAASSDSASYQGSANWGTKHGVSAAYSYSHSEKGGLVLSSPYLNVVETKTVNELIKQREALVAHARTLGMEIRQDRSLLSPSKPSVKGSVEPNVADTWNEHMYRSKQGLMERQIYGGTHERRRKM